MTLPDPTASAALDARNVRPVHYAYLDFVGDPVRANSSGRDVTPSGTGDSDLDGHLFTGIRHQFVDVSPIKVGLNGSDSVTVRLSALPVIDSDTLNLIGDRANWQGRIARLWRLIRNADNVQQGGFQPYYTGYMTALKIGGTGDGQYILITVETYLAAFASAANRTYLDQQRYDNGDLSAKASLPIANGVSGVIGMTPTGGGGSGNPGGGGRNFRSPAL